MSKLYDLMSTNQGRDYSVFSFFFFFFIHTLHAGYMTAIYCFSCLGVPQGDTYLLWTN